MKKDFLKNITLLYVEDEIEVNELTSAFLSKFVGKVISATDGEEGLELFKTYYEDPNKKNIDIVITDINMPKMNGLDMLFEINKIDSFIPSIITTAHNDASFLQKAINLRVRSYVNKPLNMKSLIDSIIITYEPIYLRNKLENFNNDLQKKVERKTYELQSILDAQDNLILVVTIDGTTAVNKTLLDFFGYENSTEFIEKQKCISELFIEKSNYFSTENCNNWVEEIMQREDNNRVVVMKNKKNEEIIFRVNIKSFMFHTKHFVVSFTDITDLKNYTYELQYQATHDNLTKLYNRQKLNSEIEKEIVRENRYQHGLSLMMLDIDKFKIVNDTYGHDVGDIVLKDLSNIIVESIRSTDYACRWGGEEFLVLLPETTLTESLTVAEHIRENIEKYSNPSIPQKITISIGVAQFEVEKDDAATFVKKVDIAMYKAKTTGRNKVVQYEK